MLFGSGADSCDCEELEKFDTEIWSIAIPLIACYSLLLIVGVTNVYRFIKVKSMNKNLALIYIFSLLSSLCWLLCFSLVTEPNKY